MRKREDVFTLLVRSVCASYRNDASAPSVLLSYVEGAGFYASIVRYRQPFGQGKSVVCNVSGLASPQAALKALAHCWLQVWMGLEPVVLKSSSRRPMKRAGGHR